MIVLNEVEIKLAKELLLTIIKKEPNVTYKELAERIEPPIHHRHVGKHIGKISELCAELGLPLLSAKVINTTSHKAGDGFYPLFKELGIPTDGLSETDLFKRELQRIRQCQDWWKLSEQLGLGIFNYDPVLVDSREIRLLPMSKKYEFPDMSYEEIQKSYFLNHLIKEQQGYYYFRNTGITCPEGSLILFQIDGEVIASARLLRTEKFKVPKEGLYKGAIVFDTNSISVFNPITAEEIASIDSTFRGFSQVKQKLDYSKIDDVLNLIDKKQQSQFPEELGLLESEKYIEGVKKQITINAYERNEKARKECIKIHGSDCKICGFDFGKVYGKEFEGKIHIHHIKPLNEIDETYEVNPATDLIPVCPNCHMILHSKVGGVYSVAEVRKMIGVKI